MSTVIDSGQLAKPVIDLAEHLNADEVRRLREVIAEMRTRTRRDSDSAAAAAMHARRLLSAVDLKALGIAYTGVHLWRMSRSGQFPKPIKLSDGASSKSTNFWVASEIFDWIDAKIAASRNKEVTA